MIPHPTATPCPVYESQFPPLNTDTDDTTTNLDFTTALRASFRDVKPRRTRKSSVQFTIHEDNHGQQPKDLASRATLLQPPRRVPTSHKDNDMSRSRLQPVSESRQTGSPATRYEMTKLQRAPRRSALMLSTVPERAAHDLTLPVFPQWREDRPARRGTLYIPNEDTTMPSAYMGVFSPIKDIDLQQNNSKNSTAQIELTGIAAQMAVKRGARRSLMGNTPRRGVLQPAQKVPQEMATSEDRHGPGGGKENVPPGHSLMRKQHEHSASKRTYTQPKRSDQIRYAVSTGERSNVYGPTKSSLLKRESPKSEALQDSRSKPAWGRGIKLMSSTATMISTSAHTPESVALRVAKPSSLKTMVPTRFILPSLHAEPVLQNYPILQADISNPGLYEENWLQHQEVAITQLINNLFSASRHNHDCYATQMRHRLLGMYDSSSMLLMQKRLQAGILYGSLRMPQDTLDQGTKLQTDVGLKKRFTDLWLQTYDLAALESALEVVVGRACRPDSRHASTGISSSSKAHKIRIFNFLETFLVRNEDAKPDLNTETRAAWMMQRTFLRSLILVKLLDLTKAESGVGMVRCLFQRSSPYKTSISVVQALVQMLNPAAGDPTRALNHLDYTVTHAQYPLQEFDYGIENLATDMRDGVRLVRLVELLLYPSASSALKTNHDAGTTTILFPEGDMVEFDKDTDWPLSQHLKPNAKSRAVRLWNVQLALSAVQNVQGLGALTDGITADDVVDGFREKTIRLLWALIGKCGLGGLIDWQDLRWEIRRLGRNLGGYTPDDFDEEEPNAGNLSFRACKRLLREWARVVTLAHGVLVQNFTTNFADGKAFEAIVNEYEPYFGADSTPPVTQKTTSLEERLAYLGCSSQFAQLFANPQEIHIFDRDFVLTALAFLCSRLLAPSRQSRAATVIQQTWRRHWSKIEKTRKQEKSEVALACAALVHAKKKGRLADCEKDSCGFDDMQSSRVPYSRNFQTQMSPASSEGDIWLSL